MRNLVLLVATTATLFLVPTAANAAMTDVLEGDLTCGVVQDNASVTTAIGQRWCGSQSGSITNTVVPALPSDRSTHKTFDGVPLDVNVAFPPDPNPAADTDWPVVGMYHTYAARKAEFDTMQRWLDKGYAVFSITSKSLRAKVRCGGSVDSCAKANIKFKGSGKKKGLIAKQGGVRVGPGKSRTVAFKLTKRGRKIFGNSKKVIRRNGQRKAKTVKGLKKLRGRAVVTDSNSGSGRSITIKRIGRVK